MATPIEFVPLEADKCPECRRIRGAWYDDRNRHMATEYLAGVEPYVIAKGYGVSPTRVREIVVNELGLMAWQANARVQRHNAIKGKEEEE